MSVPLTIIVAIDRERGIGKDNSLPWRLPEDLAFFKRTTTGFPIIMGRKTFDSIGRPLPGRKNIVITRNPAWHHEGVEVAASLDDAVSLADGAKQAFIIGGAQIFTEALPWVHRLHVTEIDGAFGCDTFFTPIDGHTWRETFRERHHSESSALDFAFVTYERI